MDELTENPRILSPDERLAGITTYYLVDIENTGNNWIKYIPQNEKNKVFLFFTMPSPHMSYADLEAITRCCGELNCFQCEHGSNAVDFQLSSFLGYLLASAKNTDRFCILSNDKGYDSVCNFCGQRGFCISRMITSKLSAPAANMPAVCESPAAASPTVAPQNEKDAGKSTVRNQCVQIIQNTLPKENEAHSDSIYSLLESHKSSNLQVVYQSFIKTYGQKSGLEYYKSVKSVIKKVQSLINDAV